MNYATAVRDLITNNIGTELKNNFDRLKILHH